jgi:tetratricopeptide (TPR) repeat protein
LDLGEQEQARSSLEEAVAIHQALGDRWEIGNALNNLANVLRAQNDYAAAKAMYNESLEIYRDLRDKWALAYLFEDVAWLSALQGDGGRTVRLCASASVLRADINAPLTSCETEKLNAAIEPARSLMRSEEISLAETEGKDMDLDEAILYALAACRKSRC